MPTDSSLREPDSVRARSLLLVGPSHPFRGGIVHHTTLLYRSLAARHTVRFVSFRRQYLGFMYPGKSDRDPSRAPIEAAASSGGAGVRDPVEHRLDVLRPDGFYRLGREARGLDAVVLPWWVAAWAPFHALLLLGLRRRSRVIFVCHNVTEHESSPAKRALTRSVLTQGDGFVVQSDAEAGTLAKLLGRPAAIRVCPHPSYDVFDSGRLDRREARAQLGLPQHARVLLFFGFVRPYKGVDVLLRAYAQRTALDDDLHLLVVGECWQDEAKLRHLHAQLQLPRCRLVLQYVPNETVESYVKASDLVVLPYLSGTGSGIAQVAFGMNTPVVASRIPAFADVVRDGETGLLVPPGDVEALADAIGRALEPEWQRAARENIRREAGRFSWQALVDAIDSFLPDAKESNA